MESSDPVEVPGAVPVFPLPQVVFFPGAILPLHIFEDRYRAMVRDALDGSRVIAMGLLKPGWETDYHEAPEVFGVGCAGQIEEVQELADGRFNLSLRGLTRVRFEEFIQDLPYRVARVRLLPEIEPAARPTEAEVSLLASFSILHRSNHGQPVSLSVNSGVPFGVLLNSLCLHADIDPYLKQELLEISDLHARSTALTTLLDHKIGEAIRSGELDLGVPPGTAVN